MKDKRTKVSADVAWYLSKHGLHVDLRLGGAIHSIETGQARAFGHALLKAADQVEAKMQALIDADMEAP